MKFELVNSILRSGIEQSFNAVLITDSGTDNRDHKIVYANPAFCRMTGYSEDELIGQNPRILQGKDTNPDVIQRLRQALANREFFEGSTVNYKKDGTPYEVKWNISPVFDEQNQLSHYISVQQDISSLIAAQRHATLLARAFNATQDAVFITNKEGVIEFCNQSMTRITGYPVTECLGQNPRFLKSGRHGADFYDKLWNTIESGEPFHATFINKRKDGALIHCDQIISPLFNDKGEIEHYVSSFRDTTAREVETQRYKDMVRLDILTQTLRRGAGELVLEQAYSEARGTSPIAVSVAMIDIDFFKKVNDNFGHSAGDEVLRVVGRTLVAMLRGSDSVIRWGGEEFLVLFHDCDLADAVQIAENCRKAIAAVEFDKVGRVTVSGGVAQLRSDETLQAVIDRADKALYQAKEQGRNRVISSN